LNSMAASTAQESLQSVADEQVLYLTTIGRTTGLLRVIEIWFVVCRERLYLFAETGEAAGWVKNIMWFPSNTEAQRASPISGWCITCVTVRFTAAARLLGYVDCLSRVLGDQYVRFCGEEVVAISSPYPTT
jgi:F420H(2)-dependent quinone reductase